MLRYLVRLSNEGKYAPSDRAALLTRARASVGGLKARVGDARVGSHSVELDLFAQDEAQIEAAVPLLSSVIGAVEGVRRLEAAKAPVSKAGAVEEARGLFNEERFWECHEALERVWLKEGGEEKELQQGIILVAAAFVHHQKNRDKACLSVLRRAYDKLQWQGKDYYGVDLESLRSNVRGTLESGRVCAFKL